MSKITLSEAFDLYRLEAIEFKNQSAKTVEMNALAGKSLIKHSGDIFIQDLTFEHVRKWKEHLLYGRSQNTARGYLIKLRTVLKHLKLRGYDVLDYELVALPKRTETPINYLSEKEVSDSLIAFSRLKRAIRS